MKRLFKLRKQWIIFERKNLGSFEELSISFISHTTLSLTPTHNLEDILHVRRTSVQLMGGGNQGHFSQEGNRKKADHITAIWCLCSRLMFIIIRPRRILGPQNLVNKTNDETKSLHLSFSRSSLSSFLPPSLYFLLPSFSIFDLGLKSMV